MLNYLITLAVFSVTLFSCKQGPKMDTITGKSGEIVVVIGKEAWKDTIGSTIRATLAQPQAGLPQEEPIFHLISVPPEAFVNLFRTHRNILTVKISSTYTEPKVEFTNNTWAYPQTVVNIQAKSPENFEELFKANSLKIMGFFLKADKDRLISTYRKNYEKSVYETLLKDFHIKLYVPVGFSIVKKDSTFAWIRYDTPQITQNILVYTYPYNSDSTFTEKFQLIKRNIITKNNIPGPTPGSYMTTEMGFPQDFSILKFNGNYASEMRGLWKVENDFMGGPYISLSVLDPVRKRVVTVEGDVYAPKDNKRNFIRQVAAMVYSLEFPNQNIDDKITDQLESGN